MSTLSTSSTRVVIIVLFVFFFAVITFSFLVSRSSLVLTELSGNTMGTRYTVKYRDAPDASSSQIIHAEIERQLVETNRVMSTYDPDSELSLLNRAETTDWLLVSKSLYSVIETAKEISRQSQGAFDVTIGPLVNLWGFGPESRPKRLPDQAKIDAVLARTGYNKLELHETNSAVRKLRSDLYVDLSGIAKGYAVDQIAVILERHGIEHYMIEIGGEIRANGKNAQGIPWQIGIESPQSLNYSVQKIIPVKNTALATSGNYRNYFSIDGKQYMHIIDPVTGWPVENHLASVTVMAETCMLADAWATALLVMGLERGIRLAEQLGLSALFIVSRNGAFVERATSHFESKSSQTFLATFLASFLVMAIAVGAMAAGTLMGRKPLAGSCGGLGRFGLECDAGCQKSCANSTSHIVSLDKPEK
ncbi:MAG TPA: FAD:protein FMN transferase ApbE [Nitrosomonas nitrosa]|uniref:FAD:protein FMN transferase n=1 Tax=Nitrosomonas nitrosa TaxID=52442 RepID=UPI000D4611F5|nr:FAD:protein FMN transferase [Nitrosomonas nitrosa]PTR04882.1 thiamine biosynthesis lipoprotein [Nitrosomonas nitrosa]HBZ31124.1 FAD:protein FMN transferase ApbE [Nitrosomonas nitrosa]HNP50923.1 FAD:protein FMN transferase [Nitrosomonas nitrosa]